MNKLFTFLFIIFLILWGISCSNGDEVIPDTQTEPPPTMPPAPTVPPSAPPATPVPDTAPPVVTIVNPSDNAVVSGSFSFAGIAEDESAIAKVEVRIDAGGWTTLPSPGVYWSYTIDSFLLSEGAHSASIRATDSKNYLSAEETINFTIDQTVPAVAIASPSHGDTLKGTIDIEGTASDTNGINRVYINPNEGAQYYDTGLTTSWNYGFDSTSVIDGSRIISVMAFDTAGLYSITNIAVVVDNTNPSVAIVSHNDQDTVATGFILTGTAFDSLGLDRVEVKIGSNANDLASGTTGWSYNVAGGDLSVGANVIQVIAYDIAGNFTTESFVIYYDDTPPALSVINPSANSYQRGSSIVINGTVTNLTGVDTVEINVDNAGYTSTVFDGTNWSYTFNSLSPLVTGKYIRVYIRAVDLVTFANDIASVSFYVDNTAPVGSITSPLQGAFVTDSGSVVITGTVNENVAMGSIDLNIDDTVVSEDYLSIPFTGSWWSYTWSTTANFSGDCTITATFTDAAGNVSVADNVTVTLSNLVPTGSFFSPANGTVVAGSLDVEITATAAGANSISTVTLQVDNTTPVSTVLDGVSGRYDYTLNTISLSDGNHTLKAVITDDGNNTTTINISITVDNEEPDVVILYPSNTNQGDSFLFSTVLVNGTASDVHLSSVMIQFDGETPVAVNNLESWDYSWNTVAYPGAKNGVVITVTATDSVGNVGTAMATVDVRPKIDSISLYSGIRGETIEVYGYNFNDALDNFHVVFPAGTGTVNASTPVIGTNGPTGESISMAIPATASSGDVFVEEGSVIIESNAVHLDVWDHSSLAGSTGTGAQDTYISANNNRYQFMNIGKGIYRSANGASAVVIENGTGGTTYGANPSIAVKTVDASTDHVFAVYGYKNGGDTRVRIAVSTNSGASYGTVSFVEPGGVSVKTMDTNAYFSLAYNPVTDKIGLLYRDAADSKLKYTTASAATPTVWSSSLTVDSNSSNGLYSKLLYDTAGTPYLLYYDEINRKLIFAYHTGVFFVTRVVDTAPFKGEYCSMALDASNGIHIGYYDANNGDMRYAYAASKTSNFVITTLSSAGITGYYSDIAVDSNGKPHVAFLNFNLSTIEYTYYDGLAWHSVPKPDSLGSSVLTRMAVRSDSSDQIFIGYTSSSGTLDLLVYYP